MTLPIEEYYALANSQRFLYELLDPIKSPKVHKDIRNKAAQCLKHYPTLMRLEELYESENVKIPRRY